MFSKELLNSAVKGVIELLRIIVIYVVAWLLTEGIALFVDGLSTDAQTKLLITGALTALFKAVDKWIHEYGKETGTESLVTGITRF